MVDKITQFRDEYSFLSNFYKFETPLMYKSISYPTNEHFYHSMKTTNIKVKKQIAQHPSKGLKSFSRNNVVLRDNWEDVKNKVMLYGLRYKFSREYNPELSRMLLKTGDRIIEEGNWWNDKYWGVCLKTGVGENVLGRMLMKVRRESRL